MKRLSLIAVCSLLTHPLVGWHCPSAGAAQITRDVLPEGAGLAARYPGDRGIERDPSVLFADDFENGDVGSLSERWQSVSDEGSKVLAFSADSPAGSAGKRALQMTATLGTNTGGHLYTRLTRGVETLYARFYVKFAPDPGYIHHFVHMGGYEPSTTWPQGGAGQRPRGDERATVGIEPTGVYGAFPAPGVWNFYAYWHDMRVSADGKYWGQSIRPKESVLLVPRNRWQCVEVMMKLNSAPDKADGELALWLDGKLALQVKKGTPRGPWTGLGFLTVGQGGEPFEGFRWRTSNDLKINFFWLLHYVTDLAGRQNRVANPNPVNRVWFDNIVLATRYIGPVQDK